jgi:diaminopimelate decarboxylase
MVTVCGKCCESGDVLMRDVWLPKAQRGDILAMFTTGAYGYSMASIYNKNPIPAVVLVKDGRAELMVMRQSYDDMIKNELIPDSLK